MKIQRISQYQHELNFPNYLSSNADYRSAFLQSELGKIYQAIPWEALVKVLDLQDHKKGPQSIFSPRGKVGLMFLKHYAACSDSKLIEQLNANIDYQYFCDLYIPPSERLTNYKIVSEIRCDLAARLDIGEAQKVLVKHWLPHMENTNSATYDATCYESAIRYPTIEKLLWESVDWSYGQLQSLSAQAGVKCIRTKYRKWAIRYVQFSKMRRKSTKEKRALRRSLLKLLAKINKQLAYLEGLEVEYKVPPKYEQRRAAIQKVYEQQYQFFYEQVSPKDKIVSIDKPYLRPIVRGKEKKPVEFGAKVHKVQVDGISFIEHLSFDAFHEGNRLEDAIYMTQALCRSSLKIIGADGIYATNKNRRFVSSKNIQTDFKPKGKKSKHHQHKKLLAKAITKERASRLEGSFGTDKEHFLLKKIQARTKETETLWVFFGIHTSNALKIGRRITQKLKTAA